jgi:hypothetical protein
MIRRRSCNHEYAFRIRRQWYTRWFGVFSSRRRYCCNSCRRRFWANAFREISARPQAPVPLAHK